jgi:dipeptidase E
MSKRMLLISNSFEFGRDFLDHCETHIMRLLTRTQRVLFVPYALRDLDAYATRVQERLHHMDLKVESIHTTQRMKDAVEAAEAIFIGGGNTFLLLERLYAFDLVGSIRERVEDGLTYIGSSAGVNVACVSIKTTNDMPIVEPPTFAALNLLPFNINPHYIEPDESSRHMGETRDARIREFHEHNEEVVVGLREGGMLCVDGRSIVLEGRTGARVFRKDCPPQDYPPGARLDFLLT